MKITHDAPNKAFFAYDDDGQQMGTIEYSVTGQGDFSADSTRVSPAYEGRGVARKLADALVEYARQESKGIVPACSYVENLFARQSETYADVAR